LRTAPTSCRDERFGAIAGVKSITLPANIKITTLSTFIVPRYCAKPPFTPAIGRRVIGGITTLKSLTNFNIRSSLPSTPTNKSQYHATIEGQHFSISQHFSTIQHFNSPTPRGKKPA